VFKANKYLVTFLASACLLTLLTAGLLHALIPHHHGAIDHHGDDQETAVWTDLHSAVLHDQKKFLAVFSESLLLTVLSAIAVSLLLVRIPKYNLEVVALDPNAGRRLRRGIVPHRKFR
jgi:hypothetical protein